MSEWRYLPGGAVKHQLVRAGDVVAVCGRGPWAVWEWRGTGGQVECDTVAWLPVCRNCVRMGALP